jgi:hypothetical protein
MHVSRGTCSTFVLPYLVRAMVDKKVDPAEFALYNFNDESIGESLSKEMEKVRK